MCQTACTEVRDSRILSRHKKKLCWGHILINHLTVNSKKVCGVQAIKDDTWMPLVICQKCGDVIRSESYTEEVKLAE